MISVLCRQVGCSSVLWPSCCIQYGQHFHFHSLAVIVATVWKTTLLGTWQVLCSQLSVYVQAGSCTKSE